MLFLGNHRKIMNIIYGLLGIAYAYFAYKYIFKHYDIVNANFTKIMITSMILFSVYYLASFLYFRYISKSDFWEDRFSRTTFVTMISFAIFILIELYRQTGEIGQTFNAFMQLIIITMIPPLMIWSVIFLLNNYKNK